MGGLGFRVIILTLFVSNIRVISLRRALDAPFLGYLGLCIECTRPQVKYPQ